VEALRIEEERSRLDFSGMDNGGPRGGFHLDVVARRLDFWIAPEAPDIEERVRLAWPGWSVVWHRDAFEAHLELAGDALRLPSPAEPELRQRVLEILQRSARRHSPVDGVIDFVGQMTAEGRDVEVNSYALRDDRLELAEDERELILAVALETYLQKLG